MKKMRAQEVIELFKVLSKSGQRLTGEQVNARLAEGGWALSLSPIMAAADHDLEDVTTIKTGIEAFDRASGGGIPLGQVTIIAGKTGEGKSTLASQIVAHAVDTPSPVYTAHVQTGVQYHKALILSNEMADWSVKATLCRQLAGRKYITGTHQMVLHKDGVTFDTVDRTWVMDEAKAAIKKFYGDKLFWYEPDGASADPQGDLEAAIRYGVYCNGVDLVVLDNLMSIAGEFQLSPKYKNVTSENAIYTHFANWAASLAHELNIAILIVAHKRKGANTSGKTAKGSTVELNDDICGSSNVANSAGMIIHLTAEDISRPARVLHISKNRVFGKLSYDTIKLTFDEVTKRLGGETKGDGKENDLPTNGIVTIYPDWRSDAGAWAEAYEKEKGGPANGHGGN